MRGCFLGLIRWYCSLTHSNATILCDFFSTRPLSSCDVRCNVYILGKHVRISDQRCTYFALLLLSSCLDTTLACALFFLSQRCSVELDDGTLTVDLRLYSRRCRATHMHIKPGNDNDAPIKSRAMATIVYYSLSWRGGGGDLTGIRATRTVGLSRSRTESVIPFLLVWGFVWLASEMEVPLATFFCALVPIALCNQWQGQSA